GESLAMNPRMPLPREHAVFLLRHEEAEALGERLAVLAVKRLIRGAEVRQAREARDRDGVRLAPRAVLSLVLGEPLQPLGAGGFERFGMVVALRGLRRRLRDDEHSDQSDPDRSGSLHGDSPVFGGFRNHGPLSRRTGRRGRLVMAWGAGCYK